MPKSTAPAARGPAAKPAPTIRFTARLSSPREESAKTPSWTFLVLPKAASRKLPSRGMVSVGGSLNGAPFQATLEPDGAGGHWLRVDQELRAAAKATSGDTVALQITPLAPDREPEPKVPPNLKKALTDAPQKARDVWSDITPAARRDWIHWITSAKQAETRERRIAAACDMLAKGKRRACCFDRSGMYSKSLSCPIAADEPK